MPSEQGRRKWAQGEIQKEERIQIHLNFELATLISYVHTAILNTHNALKHTCSTAALISTLDLKMHGSNSQSHPKRWSAHTLASGH